MRFNYNSEKKQWEKWKKEEEKNMRILGVDENIIRELHKYDWEVFKENRRYRTQEILFDPYLFMNNSVCDSKEYYSFDDILSDIENESLYLILSHTDDITLQIIYLKIFGYKVKEISKMLNISSIAVYHRIRRLREKLKNLRI